MPDNTQEQPKKKRKRIIVKPKPVWNSNMVMDKKKKL